MHVLGQMRDNGIGKGLRAHSALNGAGLGTTHVTGNLLTLVERGRNGGANAIGRVVLAQVIEHHSRGQNLGRGVSDILASDIGRGAVRRLEDGAVGTDVGTRSHTQSPYQASTQVADDVAVQVGQHQDIEVIGVLDQTHAGGVDDLVVELDIGIVGGHLARNAQEQAIGRLHDVGLMHGRHLFAAAAAGVLKSVLHNAAALGELRMGAGAGCDDFLCLTYGTGVGGSIVMNGSVYPGASFSAGSFGGMVIHPEEKAGTDSLEGCYERCASTTGLVRRVKKVDGSLDNGKKIFAAKDRPEIKEQIDAWINDICTGLVTLCCIFNPSRIILGGGIMAQEYVLSEVNRKVKAQIAPGLGIVEIVPAKLANTAGMMGAVSLAEKLLAQ